VVLVLQTRGAGRLLNRDNVYGSTETYGNCAVTDADDPLALRLHSQGLPLSLSTFCAMLRT
jgi:fatty-acyl-CoA synthase